MEILKLLKHGFKVESKNYKKEKMQKDEKPNYGYEHAKPKTFSLDCHKILCNIFFCIMKCMLSNFFNLYMSGKAYLENGKIKMSYRMTF